MLTPQICIRDFPHSKVLEEHIEDRVEKLSQFYQHIQSCRVSVEMPQKHKHQGKLYSVSIDLSVPGKELVVNRKRNEDVYVAMRDAFNAIERQLTAFARRRRGDVKRHHNHAQHGMIKKIFADEGYGFIMDHQGNEIYFNDLSLVNCNFDKLAIGDAVSFVEIADKTGLHASRVMREKHQVFSAEHAA